MESPQRKSMFDLGCYVDAHGRLCTLVVII